jgi:hypothetical protein
VGGYFKAMKWLIVEDALRDRKGHWLEYASFRCSKFSVLGGERCVAVNQKN